MSDFQIVKKPKPERPAEPQIIEPWFRSRSESLAIKRTQNLAERQKFACFFAINGCLRCGTREKPHCGEGLCSACHPWFTAKLRQAIQAKLRGEL